MTQSRGVFYSNYDLYEAPGVDGKSYDGPGKSFYANMSEYKSVKDFLQKSKKTKRKTRIRKRAVQILSLACNCESDEDINNIDYVADEYNTDFEPIKDHPYINGIIDYADTLEKDFILFPDKG